MSETKRCNGIRFTKKELEYLVFGLDKAGKHLQTLDNLNMRSLSPHLREVENLKARLLPTLERMAACASKI